MFSGILISLIGGGIPQLPPGNLTKPGAHPHVPSGNNVRGGAHPQLPSDNWIRGGLHPLTRGGCKLLNIV